MNCCVFCRILFYNQCICALHSVSGIFSKNLLYRIISSSWLSLSFLNPAKGLGEVCKPQPLLILRHPGSGKPHLKAC